MNSPRRLTMSIPEAGKLVAGLGRSASYAAASRGDIPIIKIGGRKVVPIGTLYKMFGLEYDDERDQTPSIA